NDVFVRDRCLGAPGCIPHTDIASVATNGMGTHSDINTPSLSANGRIVTFTTTSPDLPPHVSGFYDVFTPALDTRITEVASRLPGGLPSDSDVYGGGLSRNGRYVALDTTYFPDSQWPGSFGGGLVYDRLTGVTEHIDFDTDGSIHPNEVFPILSG